MSRFLEYFFLWGMFCVNTSQLLQAAFKGSQLTRKLGVKQKPVHPPGRPQGGNLLVFSNNMRLESPALCLTTALKYCVEGKHRADSPLEGGQGGVTRSVAGTIFRLSSIITFLAICFFTSSASAQLIPVLGSQRAGTAMYQFLKIGVGGRAVGMGESFVAVANDASALYWNPAGITQVQDNELIFSHVSWPVDVRHEFFGYVLPLGSVNRLGFSVSALHTDEFEETTEFQPLGTGNFVSFGDIAVGLTFARQMTDRFSVGATVKYVDENLAELHARNVLIDFGTYYWTGFGSTRFAVSVLNFGTNIEPSGTTTHRDGSETTDFQDFAPPTIFRIGFASEFIDDEKQKLTGSIQLNHPNDNAENVNLGVEYWWNKTLALRGGYRVNVEEESFAFGGGLNVPLNLIDLHLDFSYSDFGRLGSASRFSAKINF